MPDDSIGVLLVEDNPTDAFLVREALEGFDNHSFDLTHVEELGEALDQIAQGTFDVVLLDLGLPDSQGLDTLVTLQNHYPEVAVVVLTGLADELSARGALQHGAQDYLIKGIESRQTLNRSIRYALERKRADTKIRNLARFPDENPDPVLRISRNGAVLYANKAAVPLMRKWGRELGQNLPDQHLQPLLECFKSGWNNEIVVTCGDRIYSLVTAPIIESGYMNVYGRDITERVRAEQEIKNSEERLKVLFECAPDACFLIDLQGVFVDGNRAAEELFGYSREELAGRNLLTLGIVPPEELHAAARRLDQNRQGASTGPDEFYLIRKDGSRTPVEVRAHPVRIRDQVHILGIARNISDRLKSEGEQRRLATAIEQSAEAVLITGTDGAIVYVNPAFERISGYSREEAMGQNPRFLKSGRHEDRFYRDMWTTLSSGKVWEGRIINRRKDGSLYEEDATISAVVNPSGEITNYVAVMRDVSKEAALEAQLRQAQKMEAIGQLAGGVAHDFNNLLQVILGHASLMANGAPLDDSAAEDLQMIQDAAERASRLTRQLLAFSRRQMLMPVDLNLNDLIADLMKMLRRIIGEDIELELHPGHELGLVHADPGQMEQIIINLCVNARDAMPDGGSIVIATENVSLNRSFSDAHPWAREGDYVLLSISDTGAGIPPEIKDHIFEPFFTTKEVGKGTGLGLAMVYGTVRQHDGLIHVYSEPGIGATFKIYIPMINAAEVLKTDQAPEPAGVGNEAILLAEDEENVRKLAARILGNAGYRVVAVTNGEEAIHSFEANPSAFDLILLDVVMPRVSGGAAHDQIRAIRPEIPVLFTSGYSMQRGQSELKLDEKTQFIQKPYAPTDLLRKVRDSLDRKSANHKG